MILILIMIMITIRITIIIFIIYIKKYTFSYKNSFFTLSSITEKFCHINNLKQFVKIGMNINFKSSCKRYDFDVFFHEENIRPEGMRFLAFQDMGINN